MDSIVRMTRYGVLVFWIAFGLTYWAPLLKRPDPAG